MQITRGKIAKAQKVVCYGPEGVGKSTFASCFPNVVFLDVEDSTLNMDVLRFPKPTSWQMIFSILEQVKANPGEIKTIAIDTADWAERLAKEAVIQNGGSQIKSIEDYGYGKGFTMLNEEFGKLLNKCSEIVDKGINVVFLAHAAMRKQELPDEMGAFDRWELKLEKKVAPLLKEWADMVLFANYKTFVIEDSKTKTKKATGGQQRVMYTTHHATRDAKNRHGLPDELPFEFSSIAHIFNQATINIPEPVKATPAVENEPFREGTIKEVDPVNEQRIEEPVKAVSEPEINFPSSVSVAMQDLMKAEGISAQDVVDYLITAGSFPSGMKAENTTADVWNWVQSNWPQVKEQVKKLQLKL